MQQTQAVPQALECRLEAGPPDEARADISVGALRWNIFARANVPLFNNPNAWMCATLPVAMRSGRAIKLSEPATASMMSAANSAQSQLHAWFPDLKLVQLGESDQDRPVPESRGVGAFFSCGADSFFTAIEHTNCITHLIFVIGFDISLTKPHLAEKAVENAQQAADKMGKELIVVHTNIRQLQTTSLLEWGRHYHGAALAFIAHLLTPHLHTVIVPSTYSGDDLKPWGSAPQLDPLWSTADLTIAHDALLQRRSKFDKLVESPIAMAHLRVCYQQSAPDSQLNCGKCYKCLRAKQSIATSGGSSEAISGVITPSAIVKTAIRPPFEPKMYKKWHGEARETNGYTRSLQAAFLAASVISRLRKHTYDPALRLLITVMSRRKFAAVKADT